MERGFKQARYDVMSALEAGDYQHAIRGEIDVKNQLATGEVSATEVIEIIRHCNGMHHCSSPHHNVPDIEVHVLKRVGWYIKFYFIEPDVWFISVHR
ncbi:hypothetical protein [Pseudomonas fontis]|uniref:Uncharacterized protein n=1 Tax=Pseudomonas fontis TaxID=2942633 RepID=A0ABT5NQJ4_9PSED|nr:hypothetical protein [Pseudomonas fontis]MDD0974630.1 hypothetical protein [Pseudomonas fontis]MDD0990427.1 hypothetical protein [Pseudomonas fontis]